MKKILLLLTGLTIISCSSDDDTGVIDQSAELIGTWRGSSGAFGSDPTNIVTSSYTYTITYYEDGTMTWTLEDFDATLFYDIEITGSNTYTSTDREDGFALDHRYKIEGNNLTLTEPYGSGGRIFIEGEETLLSFWVRVE